MKAAEDPVEKGGEHLRQNKAREEGRMRMVVENVKGTTCARTVLSWIYQEFSVGVREYTQRAVLGVVMGDLDLERCRSRLLALRNKPPLPLSNGKWTVAQQLRHFSRDRRVASGIPSAQGRVHRRVASMPCPARLDQEGPDDARPIRWHPRD